MAGATILTGQADTEHAARSQLLRYLKTYLEKDGWHVQGGIAHAIMPPENLSQKPTHYMSVLLIKP